MDKEILEKLISKDLSTWGIAKELNTTQMNVRYWLKKYKLQTNIKKNKLENNKKCPRCKEVKSMNDFYKHNKKSSYCRHCISQSNKERRIESKNRAVEYLGGKCVNCGYNKCNDALEFHHLNRKEKDSKYNSFKSIYSEKLLKELDKCILLCANCHRELHHNERTLGKH